MDILGDAIFKENLMTWACVCTVIIIGIFIKFIRK
jgi:hypothetical protein